LLEIAVCARWYPKLQNPVISCAQGFDSKYIQTHRYIAAAMQKAVCKSLYKTPMARLI